MPSSKRLPKGLSINPMEGKIVYRLYDTDIVTIDTRLNGFTLNTGGHYTNHTKKCMNIALLPFGFNVTQKQGQWSIDKVDQDNYRPLNYYDGITIY